QSELFDAPQALHERAVDQENLMRSQLERPPCWIIDMFRAGRVIPTIRDGVQTQFDGLQPSLCERIDGRKQLWAGASQSLQHVLYAGAPRLAHAAADATSPSARLALSAASFRRLSKA